VNLRIVLQFAKGPAKVAAAPIRLLGNLGSELLCQLRIIREDGHARALIPEWQATVVIGSSRLARLNVHGAGDGIGAEILRRSSVNEDRGFIAVKDVGETVDIGLDGVAKRPPHRQAQLITEDVVFVIARPYQ